MRRLAVLAAVVTSAAVTAAAQLPPTDTCRRVVPDRTQSISWISPPDAEVRHELARWCGSVGPAVLESKANPSGARIGDRLVVISWNIHVGGGNVDALLERLQRGDFTAGHPVRQYVLLLQEAFRSGDDVPAVLPQRFRPPSRIAPTLSGRSREDVLTLANAHRPVSLFYVPSMRNGGIVRPVEDRGNAILSTLPLDAPMAIELPLERQRRVAIAATIRVRSAGVLRTLRVVDVHLDTAVAPLHGGPFAARRRQVEALVASLTDESTPTVVAGDFNTWGGADEPALKLMRRAFQLTGERPAGARNADARLGPTWAGPLGIHATLDHVFARAVPAMDVRRLDDRFGSDHFPLLVEIRF
jgi:endonuclease/exonuclease/phosphatase family metal-dependent hydrolase